MKIRDRKHSRTYRRQLRRRGPAPWLAAGAVLAYTALGARGVAVANAFDGADPFWDGSAAVSADAQPVRRFEIAAGPLDTTLRAFETIAGVHVTLPSESLRGIQSGGVKGDYTAEQALRELLLGTGVTYRFNSPDAVQLQLRVRSESVLVTGRLTPLSSPKYTEPLRDLPQTVSVIPRALIEEQGATSLRDVLQNVPGLTIQAGEGGTPAGDNLTLRGFSARNDIFVDGVRDLGPQTRDPFNLEQVEVVKGPGSVFTGRGSAGGTINLVSKAPVLGAAYGGSVAFGTDETKRVTADINHALTDSAAFRLNAMFHDADVAGRNAVTNQRWGIAPSLAFGLGTATRLTLGYFHLEQDNLSDYGIPWVPVTNNVLVAYRDRPAPVPRETYYGFKSRDAESLASDLATARFERDLQPTLTLRNQLRYGHSARDSFATPPRFASTESTLINRELRSWLTEDEIGDNQTDLTARFRSGAVEHALVAGVALSQEGNVRKLRTAPNATTTLLDPNPDDVYTGVITESPNVGDVTGKSVAVYAFDAAKLGQRLELTGGLRWDRFDVDGVNTTPEPVSRVDEMLSGRGAIVFKPKPNGSLYAAYGTSLNPSLEGLSYGVANTAIDPEKTRTLEVGSKWDFAEGRLSAAGAVFRVEKLNARTPGLLPDDPPLVLNGKQRVDGFELGVSGSIASTVRMYGTYTFLDSEIVESNTPAETGKALQNTPKNAFSIWTTYSLPGRAEIGIGARFSGLRYGNNINTRFVESYWLFDAMASYPVTSRLDLRLNLYNLANEYYFDRLGGGHVVPGAGRSALLSANVRF